MPSGHHTGPSWKRTVAIMKPRLQAEIDAGQARCVNCGRAILPGQKWAVGHIVDAAVAVASGWPRDAIDSPDNLGASHHGKGAGLNCNTKAGGQLSQAMSRDKRTEEKRFTKW